MRHRTGPIGPNPMNGTGQLGAAHWAKTTGPDRRGPWTRPNGLGPMGPKIPDHESSATAWGLGCCARPMTMAVDMDLLGGFYWRPFVFFFVALKAIDVHGRRRQSTSMEVNKATGPTKQQRCNHHLLPMARISKPIKPAEAGWEDGGGRGT